MGKKLRKWLLGKPGRRWPVDEAPLRSAGQGVEEKCDDLRLDIGMGLMAPFITLVTGFLMTLPHLFFGHWSQALGIALAALLVSAILVAVMWPDTFKKRDLLRDAYWGMMMEKYVGQRLEEFRAAGYSIFHDIEFDRPKPFNIDHVLIGPAGVFMIETKSRAKPIKGNPSLKVNGETITFSDGPFTNDPINQAMGNRKQIKELLYKLISDKKNPVCRFASADQVPVKPIILYPGWFVDLKNSTFGEVYVTNSKLLVYDIQKQAAVLSPEAVKELSDLLDKYLREQRRYLFADLNDVIKP